MTTLAVIPSRYSSSRFPGKPMVDICGKPMIQWVWEAVTQSNDIDLTIVATDDERIASLVNNFGGKAIMTDQNCLSGTDRVARVVKDIGTNFDLILNIQGDEPTIKSNTISNLVKLMRHNTDFDIGTVSCDFSNMREVYDPNNVKLVTDSKNRVLYFSRSPIPYIRGDNVFNIENNLDLNTQQLKLFKRHIGIYAFRTEALYYFNSLEQCGLEKLEMLEQLRALHFGMNIGVVSTPHKSFGVDVPSDVQLVEALLNNASVL